MSPDEQSRLTVDIGTLSGIPAANAAARETYKGEGGWQVPSELQFPYGRLSGIQLNRDVWRTYANVINRRRVQLGFL
jgi:hypothetical protein